MISYKDSDLDNKLGHNFLKRVTDYYDTNENYCIVRQDNYEGILLKQFYKIRRTRLQIDAFFEKCRAKEYTHLWVGDSLGTISGGFITLEDGTEFPAPNSKDIRSGMIKVAVEDLRVFGVDCWMNVIRESASDLYAVIEGKWNPADTFRFLCDVEQRFGNWLYLPNTHPAYEIHPSPNEKRTLLMLAIDYERNRKAQQSW